MTPLEIARRFSAPSILLIGVAYDCYFRAVRGRLGSLCYANPQQLGTSSAYRKWDGLLLAPLPEVSDICQQTLVEPVSLNTAYSSEAFVYHPVHWQHLV